MSLSVVVLTYNSARTLERCLKSVQFADEILIVDSGSTDETLEIAKIYTSRILHHPYINYGKQLNWAIEKVKGDWILVVDSDEEVTPELAQEIKNAVRENKMDGYYLPRISEFMGRRLIHVWAQDKVLRLFRKGKAKYKERELGSSPIVEGELGNLRGYLLHFPYKDLTHYLEKFNFYTSCAAREIRKKRKEAKKLAAKNSRKIEEFISLMRQEMITMLERNDRAVKLEKMIELLEEGQPRAVLHRV